ncbi:hypothetical protein JXB41_07480 [Candidatus Woesearchaeota archaeon]|nr:hypothetical protein [Candidatus Woesearchaeota archaeon]
MTSQKTNLSDFIEHPTTLSKHLLEIIQEKTDKYDSLIKSKNIFENIIKKVKLRLKYLEEYKNIYSYISQFEIKTNDILGLFSEFSEISEKIALNNLLLIYAQISEKQEPSKIITKEDLKLSCFNKLYHKKISINEFNKEFGHYALNAFELSSRRFCEYPEKEILKLASFTINYRLKKSLKLEEAVIMKKSRLFPVYCALREELKYNALLIIKELRFELLELKKKINIRNIFSLNYNKLKGLLNEN